MELFLIRHGQSEWNREGRVQGWKNPHLSDHGRRTARRLGQFMENHYGPWNPKTDLFYSSPLRRAYETAQLVGGELGFKNPRPSPGLKEISLGEWEGRLIADLRRDDARRIDMWHRDPTRVRLNRAERVGAFQRRVLKTFRQMLARSDDRISASGAPSAVRSAHGHHRLIAVTHGGVLAVLLADVVGIPVGRMWTFIMDNASLTRLWWNGRKLYLRGFNEYAPAAARPAVRLA